jgi:hypothetical protein
MRLEQRGAVAFAVVIFIALVIAVFSKGDAPLVRLLGQPELLHLLADLLHVPA